MSCGICSGFRKRPSWRWRTAMRRLRASSQSSIFTSRRVWATPWACSTTRRRPARPFSSPPASTSRVLPPPNPFCGRICRPSRARWSNGPPRGTAWPICRGSCTAPPRLHWRRRRGRYSCHCPAISCAPTPTSISPRPVALRRACAVTAPQSRGPADLLAQAKHPVIMAGDAVAQSRAHAELVELAELLGAPVYAEFVPNTASFPASHPLFRGSLVRLAPDVRKVLEQYDVLFSVGGDLFTLSLPSDVDPMPPDIKLIHLDLDPWELGKNYPPAVAILGDPKATLPDIIAAVRNRMSSLARGVARERFASASKAIAAERDALKAKARALAGATP